jgi:DNA-binding transcriptional regulator YiaG
MANIGKVLKDEIVRLSRKNANLFTRPLKSEIRALKSQVRTLKKDLKTVQESLKKSGSLQVAQGTETESAKPGRWFTGKGVKALRRKFKITQAELAALAKVSSQAVVLWERKSGKIRLRHATLDALAAVKAMSKADVKSALGLKKASKR